ncbi:hypothetical protein [Cellulomonas soli]|uniref:hypothetical protein n=1 Tax=Cellulomonas soli TaxID=931535 RepID=UPI0011BDBD3A|nr:hypothetical protein [Cellulomonas soli]NYI58110.1 Flp pilus assembly protein TadB [Cellulomonas soli]
MSAVPRARPVDSGAAREQVGTGRPPWHHLALCGAGMTVGLVSKALAGPAWPFLATALALTALAVHLGLRRYRRER